MESNNFLIKNKIRITKIKNSVKDIGLFNTGWQLIVWAKNLFFASMIINRHSKKKDSFTFEGKKYEYFYHQYNMTWTNERSIEVPIIMGMVNQATGKNILEVGNVLSHYFEPTHDILDKYEKGKKIINEDVAMFEPNKKYDLIVSISTLEHVGWDEEPKNPKKIIEAIDNLKKILASGGKIIFTAPRGYNYAMDKMIDDGEIKLNKLFYYKKINNKWVEVSWNDIKELKYGFPFGSQGLLIGIIEN